MAKTCKVCDGDIPRNRNPKVYCSKKCQAEVEGYSDIYKRRLEQVIKGSTAWRPEHPEITKNIITSDPVLIMTDPHCPIHSEVWFYQALITGLKFGCKILLLNGDLIDANQCSRWLGAQYRRKGELNDDIEAARKFIDICLGEFEKIYITLGNHDQRLIQAFSGEVSVQNLMRMIFTDPKVFMTEKHFVDINSDIRVVHPRQYSKTRGKLPADLAQRYQKHIVNGHTHHSASSYSADGKWQAIEVGCIMDVDYAFYAQQGLPNMPEMMNGFAIALPPSAGNKILNFNKFTAWSFYGVPSPKES